MFFFLDRCKVFQSDRKLFHEGTGICFSFHFIRFHFHCFCGAAVQCCAFSFVQQQYIQQAYQKRKRVAVCTYVRHVSERRGQRTSSNRPRREAYVTSDLFSPEAWRQHSWHYQVSSLQLRSIMKTLYSILNLCSLGIVFLMYYSFLGERSGRRRPPAERSALYVHTTRHCTPSPLPII